MIISIEGTWASRGYGWLLQISNDGYTLYDHTNVACIEFERGDRAQFQSAFDRVGLDGLNRLSLNVRGEISRYDFNRISELPAGYQSLDAEKNSDPLFVFDSFCEYFRQDYAFFDLRSVNWDEHCARNRALVGPDTSPESLFDCLAELIRDLRDNHVILENSSHIVVSETISELKSLLVKQFNLKSPSIGDPETVARIQPYICREFLNGSAKSAGNDTISWGFVEPGIGYLNVLKLFGLADTTVARTADNLPPHRADHANLLRDDLAAMENILDRVMADLSDAKAIIVDIRINGGGFDCLGMAVANRFCDTRHLAFTKEARDGNGFTPKQSFYLTPSRQQRFTKPVYVLTSARTASAGEVMALCMRALPNVTIVGEPTTGILSDNLAKHLPNGWKTSLSNEIYRAPDGAVFERSGVPVDVEVPVFQADDFTRGLYRAIDTSRNLAMETCG